MRSQARGLILVVLSFLTVMVLGVVSAFLSAVALGATALIVPGTGTPDPDNVAGYRENAWNRYVEGVVCTDVEECANPVLDGIDYPASFWPLSFIPRWCVPGRCDKWNESVEIGIKNLKDAVEPFLSPTSDEEVFIFGYSQGGAVVSNVFQYLAGLDLPAEVKSRFQVVTIGGIENPDGGLWQRLAWLNKLLGTPLPILDITFNPPMPVNTGIPTTSIGFEYDPVAYAPLYWGNPFAVLNAFAALDTVHGHYLDPNAEDPNDTLPYDYTPATLAPQLNCALNESNCRTDQYGNVYIMIPATSLPLTNVVRTFADSLGIGRLAKPFIDLVEPVLREIVDLGYDWSGDPAVPRPLSPLPFKLFQNWIQVGIDLAVAAVKGVEAFLGNFTAPTVAVKPETAGAELEKPKEQAPAERRREPSARDDVTPAEKTAPAETTETDLTEAIEDQEPADEPAATDTDAGEVEKTEPAPSEDSTPTLRQRSDRDGADAAPRTKRVRAAA
ncbi:PE-PPE domain-containing protein [Mycolicibacterium vaccae]|uniref:PE-PPE domain-containing protein n=1 Tax=Mycolicibacterium vaccae TaxID=1810 RepID=UPI003CF079BC